MRTLKYSILALCFVILAISGCKKRAVKPSKYKDKLVQVWQAKIVKENGTIVYNRKETTNTKPAYSGFKVTITESGNVTLTEVDNSTFSGKWELAGEKTLILKDLTPVPSKTKGTIEYTISKFTNSELVLTKNTPNPKTGNSNNEYTMEKVK